eukprot:Unigene10327_Nuclearia_a/m.31547 Unigene10327_Nuclearia_a/g.31547  ORF Unigene10327_Nuclearia_a/g.31547 Unigene10327_Nuclearia_a/m.31547 type:complete len:315 (+) Unigene10327_Nuclearia_a:3409-4353(+)
MRRRARRSAGVGSLGGAVGRGPRREHLHELELARAGRVEPDAEALEQGDLVRARRLGQGRRRGHSRREHGQERPLVAERAQEKRARGRGPAQARKEHVKHVVREQCRRAHKHRAARRARRRRRRRERVAHRTRLARRIRRRLTRRVAHARLHDRAAQVLRHGRAPELLLDHAQHETRRVRVLFGRPQERERIALGRAVLEKPPRRRQLMRAAKHRHEIPREPALQYRRRCACARTRARRSQLRRQARCRRRRRRPQHRQRRRLKLLAHLQQQQRRRLGRRRRTAARRRVDAAGGRPRRPRYHALAGHGRRRPRR